MILTIDTEKPADVAEALIILGRLSVATVTKPGPSLSRAPTTEEIDEDRTLTYVVQQMVQTHLICPKNLPRTVDQIYALCYGSPAWLGLDPNARKRLGKKFATYVKHVKHQTNGKVLKLHDRTQQNKCRYVASPTAVVVDTAPDSTNYTE